MKRLILLILSICSLFAIRAMAQSPVPYDLVGYATMNGGTTGGQGGTTVTVTTLAELKTYASTANTPYIILVSGNISSGDDKGGVVSVHNNKTIIGLGSEAFLNGIGLNISGRRNIIIRNLKFSMTSVTNTTDPLVYSPTGDEGRPQILVNSGDCIKIGNGAQNVWIDHCEFFSIDPTVQTNQDLYDGLVDVSGASKYITISWCYFHEHHKCHLIGSSDTDNYDRMITFHHNYYYKISQRTPSYRFGKGHVFNNYYYIVKGSGINSRMGACVGVEKNVFENTNSSVTTTSAGLYDVSDNTYINCTGNQPVASICSYDAPYIYTSVYQPTNEVKPTVQQYAGIGKLTNTSFFTDSVGFSTPSANVTLDGNTTLDLAVKASAGSGSVAKVQFYNGTTLLGEDDSYPYTYSWNNIAPGTYTITAVMTDHIGQTATSAERVITVNTPAGIFSSSREEEITKVYPNPAEKSFTVKLKERVKSISVTNMYGVELIKVIAVPSSGELEIGEELEKGSYVLRIEYVSKRVEVAKLVKR